MKCVTEIAERTIKEAAMSKNDFDLLSEIGSEDLRAKRYVKRVDENGKEDEEAGAAVSRAKAIYLEAFEVVRCK